MSRVVILGIAGGGKIALAAVGLLAGGWMIIDGIHVMLRGKYIGPEKPGPWSALFVKLGVDPFRLGPMFIALGVLWLVFLAATLADQTWGKYGAAAIAIASLWYLPLGSVLSLAYLLLLYFTQFR
jgi:hypothetical protein